MAIEQGRMSGWQWAAVAVTVGLNALDGFDVLSISFASPGIAREWGTTPATLGWILSMELLGMAIGSILLGGLADMIGRRNTILGCLVAMTIGMWGAGQAGGVGTLLAWRLLTGLGIGGMLAAINAAAAEFANKRWYSLAMALMVIGYPIGGVLGGLAVQGILGSGGRWRDVFHFGAIVTALFIPLTWFLVPETIAFLDRRQPAGALDRINRSLRRFGLAAVEALSPREAEGSRGSIADIFGPALIRTTILITLAYFAHILAFYFVLKWVPKIVVDMGFEARSAAGVLTWANVGGASGGALFGLAAIRLGLKRLTIIILFASTLLIFAFGQVAGNVGLGALSAMVLATGFFTNAAIVGLYTLFARVFPTHVRATGTGFAIGIGRGGAALAPIAAGYLFEAGLTLATISLVMGLGSTIAAIALILMRETDAE
ncbi:MFS transporter [Sphingomonas sp. Y38-1Y]|uniref:MFS transporter n=1 Tax=Sphingomonas sp. Y38-1Y TaxID=3078265 RepID=UPI0028EFE3E5|nr:MFS transporter [Sphingomonas sp. Y38-1Y]